MIFGKDILKIDLFLSKGLNIDYSGRIWFSNSGKITTIDNGSGHYKPNFSEIDIVKTTLIKKYGIDTSGILFTDYFK